MNSGGKTLDIPKTKYTYFSKLLYGAHFLQSIVIYDFSKSDYPAVLSKIFLWIHLGRLLDGTDINSLGKNLHINKKTFSKGCYFNFASRFITYISLGPPLYSLSTMWNCNWLGLLCACIFAYVRFISSKPFIPLSFCILSLTLSIIVYLPYYFSTSS